tara:strand:+ start:1107 stop:1301 length:195 start_codon:yes stop_codon:yes gene_type:complete
VQEIETLQRALSTLFWSVNTPAEVLVICEVNSITEEYDTVFSLVTSQVVNVLIIQSDKTHTFRI